MTDTRIERDCLGEMAIPNDRYYGIQTTRMLKVSGAAGFPVIAYPDMHIALCKIKKACALANAEIGALKPEIAKAIEQACDKVIAGGFEKEFPLDMWQGGGYTCVNMNVNEVIGNLANELMTGHKGQDAVHPNTHVNMAQSTNDTIPSATHLAIAPRLDVIIAEGEKLADAFDAKAKEFKEIVKVGRTCWQDALPVTLGQEFSGFASAVRRQVKALRDLRGGCFELIMGGNAVGTGLGAAPGYTDAFYKHISEIVGEAVHPNPNLFDGFQNPDFFLAVSGSVKSFAVTLSKISKDLRLMSSGPRAGWMEINLPALSPGRSTRQFQRWSFRLLIRSAATTWPSPWPSTKASSTSTSGMQPSTSASLKTCRSSEPKFRFCVNTALRASRPMSPAVRQKLWNRLR